MKRLLLISVLTLVTVLGVYADGDNNPRSSISLSSKEQAWVNQNNDFAFNLFSKARENENNVLSPLSVTYALAMLNNGAAGVTQQEIINTLGFSDATAEELNVFCQKMMKASTEADELTKVLNANTIFVNKGFELKPTFVEKAEKYYDATPETRDFFDGETRDVINQWASDHTEGMIKEVLSEEEFDPTVVTYLLNALYFKGTWTLKFDKNKTQKELFGGKTNVSMMQMENELPYTENDTYQALVLPYGNQSFQMTVLLPQEGKKIADVLEALKGKNWKKMFSSFDSRKVDVKFPSFEIDTDINLKEIMADLGMPSAFIPGYADFSELSEEDTYISLMKQMAKIKLDEEGTEAAAVTVIGNKRYGSDSELAVFHANHPFLYVISESSTGSIYFIGQYVGDGEEESNERKDITLSKNEWRLVTNNNGFAFDLFRAVSDENSQVISPLSVTYALGMLNNGAAGVTRDEINKVLGAIDMNDGVINTFCKKMMKESDGLDKLTKVLLSNTIFFNKNKGYELYPEFLKTANDYYNVTPDVRPFDDGKTLDAINQWASDHTEGMIDKILDEQSFDINSSSFLLNALYFKGAWTLKFDKTETRDEAFGGGKPVPMMHREDNYCYRDAKDYQAIILPYGNEAYRMTVLLPHKDKTIADVLGQIDGKEWYNNFSNLRLTKVDLKLPRFETSTDIKLNDIMSNLGMPSAFDMSDADFSLLCPVTTYIHSMKQSAKVKLDEEGTEAAAVTIIDMYDSALPEEPKIVEFHANRPFIYVISEQSTGTIFFVGQYMGEDVVTAVESPQVDSYFKKKKENDSNIYNLYGQKLSQRPARGLYIQNGRKRIAKD